MYLEIVTPDGTSFEAYSAKEIGEPTARRYALYASPGSDSETEYHAPTVGEAVRFLSRGRGDTPSPHEGDALLPG